MNRPLIAFTAVSALLSCDGACSKKRAPDPFRCERLQARAEACEKQILYHALQGIRARAATDPKDRSERQFKMFEYRFKEKLRDKQTLKQCQKFRAAKGREYKRRIAKMKECFAKQRCDAFAKCMLGL